MDWVTRDHSCSSPSTGPMSFSSGTLRTLTTSPNCPSPQTASGSQTSLSMSCEYCHQTRGSQGRGWGALGTAGGQETRSPLLYMRCSTRPAEMEVKLHWALVPLYLFLPFFSFQNSPFSMSDAETLLFSLTQGSLSREKGGQ